jgi:hypothetical protein
MGPEQQQPTNANEVVARATATRRMRLGAPGHAVEGQLVAEHGVSAERARAIVDELSRDPTIANARAHEDRIQAEALDRREDARKRARSTAIVVIILGTLLLTIFVVGMLAMLAGIIPNPIYAFVLFIVGLLLLLRGISQLRETRRS